MSKNKESLERILDSEVLGFNLKFISIYIAIYENFKDDIVSKVKYFYWSGVKQGKEQFDFYEKEVLSLSTSKENRQIKGTLAWLKKNGCIDDESIKLFKKITDIRNMLTHNMVNKLFEGIEVEVVESFASMIRLFERIDKWWIKEIEIPTSADLSAVEKANISSEEVTSLNLEFLKMITDVALNGNDKYLKILNQMEDPDNE